MKNCYQIFRVVRYFLSWNSKITSESEINAIIDTKVQDSNTIEHSLDTLLSLTDMGLGKELFVKLLDYYKTIDAEGAAFYWKEFDKDEE